MRILYEKPEGILSKSVNQGGTCDYCRASKRSYPRILRNPRYMEYIFVENREIRRGQKGADGQYGTTKVPFALQVCINVKTLDASETGGTNRAFFPLPTVKKRINTRRAWVPESGIEFLHFAILVVGKTIDSVRTKFPF